MNEPVMEDQVEGMEAYEDVFGTVMLLPSELKVTRCFWCFRTATRSKLIETVGRLRKMHFWGHLKPLAGYSKGRPACVDCQQERGLRVQQ